MRILVTGGAGFIGSHVTDRLIALGHSVVVLDNLVTGFKHNVHPEAQFVQGDITDRSLVRELFDRHRFDVVNHHAAQLDVRKSVSDPVFDAESNILGSLMLLEAARASGSVKLFMFASTGGAVYGEQEVFPASEDHPQNPISPYGVTKRSVELYLNYYEKVFGLNYVSFRYTNVYGPRQSAHGEAGVIAIFIEKMLKGETPTIHGTGEQTRDYVFVTDLVEAHARVLEHMSHSDVYNISTARETSVNQIAHELEALIPGSSAPVHGPAKAGEQARSVCSFDKIHRALGWSPSTSLADGLQQTVAWFRQRT
jgi:UDP-glucose 4-epimerase